MMVHGFERLHGYSLTAEMLGEPSPHMVTSPSAARRNTACLEFSRVTVRPSQVKTLLTGLA